MGWSSHQRAEPKSPAPKEGQGQGRGPAEAGRKGVQTYLFQVQAGQQRGMNSGLAQGRLLEAGATSSLSLRRLPPGRGTHYATSLKVLGLDLAASYTLAFLPELV